MYTYVRTIAYGLLCNCIVCIVQKIPAFISPANIGPACIGPVYDHINLGVPPAYALHGMHAGCHVSRYVACLVATNEQRIAKHRYLNLLKCKPSFQYIEEFVAYMLKYI